MLARLALTPWLGAAQVPAPPEVALEWTAPPECPDRAAVLAALSRRLGRQLGAGEAVVEGRVLRDERGGFTLRLRLSAGERSETREVADPSCAALVDAVALLVAAAVEPAVVAAVPVPSPTTEPPEVAEEVAGPQREAAPPAVEEEVALEPERWGPATPGPLEHVPQGVSKRIGGFVRLHGGGELGAVPRATGAVGLAGGLLGRRWRVELQGLFVAPQSVQRPQAQVEALLVVGAVHGCGRLGRGAVEVPLCVGIEAGTMRGRARGLQSGRAAFQGWLAGVLGASVVWHAGPRWGLWGGLQLALSPVHPSFELRGSAQTVRLWRPSVASGRLLMGVEIRLGDPWW